MKMDIDYIKQIADVMSEKSLVELSLEENGQKISLKKGDIMPNAKSPIADTQVVAETHAKAEAPAQTKAKAITSPMVGTFYNSASPDSAPFVSVSEGIFRIY